MPKLKILEGQIGPRAFQTALDALDVVGNWSWDAVSDRVRADTFVALMFNVDPTEAGVGLPLTTYVAGIHPEDRARVLALFRSNAVDGTPFASEYRVCSADAVVRSVLSRGRVSCDHRNRLVRSRGIIVDISCRTTDDDPVAQAGIEAGQAGDTLLDHAAEAAMMAHQAVCALHDPGLKANADALLFAIGRRFAQRQAAENRKHLN